MSAVATQQVVQPEIVQLKESVCCEGIQLRVDRKAGVIHGVKVLGEQSQNEGGRTYTADCRRLAIPLIEGKRVNVDHVDPGGRRSYRDRNGFLEKIQEGGDGLYGDYRYNPHHPLTPQLLWDAENAPGNVGFSIDARGRKSIGPGGKVLIEGLELVRSVDLVADPATTASLFESQDPAEPEDLLEGELAKQLALEELHSRRWRLVNNTSMMIRRCLDDTLTSVDQKREKMVALLDEWATEAKKLLAANDDASSVTSPILQTGVPMSSFKESIQMELKDLTLVELREQRADLIELVLQESDRTKQTTELQESLKAATTKTAELEEALAAYREKDRLAALEHDIQEELKAAKGVKGMQFDLANKSQVSERFLESLRSAPDAEVRKSLITDRLDLLESAARPSPGSQPYSPSKQAALQESIATARDPVARQRAWSSPN